MSNDSSFGKSLLEDKVQYCIRCCIPETQEGIKFDEMGICQACQSSEQKIHIDWAQREKQLRKILQDAKAKAGNNYDCIVPISGGKDSTFQLHVLVKVYGMKPLAVTFSHNWFSETGWYNLQNTIEQFNLDHMMFTPNRNLVNRLAKRSVEGIGDSCWHCHAGVASFPLHIAAKFNIPLLIWGESIAESSGRASYQCPVHKFDKDYALKVSVKLKPEEMICDYLTERDLYPFNMPTPEELDTAGIYGIHLGDYIFWDDERQTEFVRDTYGWKETEIEGTYKGYKSAECMMPGMHDFTCYLKRGYGRSTFHASIDVRNGLLTREEGFELSKRYDTERPEALDYYLQITGVTEEEFFEAMKKHRVGPIRDLDLPVEPKNGPNRETIMPFVEQLIEKMRSKKDPREQD
ncbi:MAG TPA: N-acetyl sugar amidotransferase [Candidatus Aquicultor sp.]|jgi:N-acetyl sugar amidotransferase